jgi:hyperosmotically inducible protein
MSAKFATALFLAGALIVPVAGYAAGTADTQSMTGKTKAVVSDAAITTKIKAGFAKDNQVSAMHIKVDTDNGIVRLTGTAKSQAEADRAAEIAQSTAGVTSVSNDIQVGASDSMKPSSSTTSGSTKY